MYRTGFKIACILMMMVLSINISWADHQKKQVVCIGDGITKGVWREEMIGNGTRWVDILASYDKDMDVINAGVDGLRTGDARYLNNVLKKYPDAEMYVIYLGINDIKDIASVDSAAAASVGAKVLRMVRIINEKTPQAEIVIVAPQRIGEENMQHAASAMGEHTPVVSDLVSASLEVVSKKSKTRFVNLLDKISPEMLPDGIHPNISGHAKIAALIWSEISHPYEELANINNNIVMAPPPVGAPTSSIVATEEVVAGVSSDIEELLGVGSMDVDRKFANKRLARAKSYVDVELTSGIITKPAYELGTAVGKMVINEVESVILGDVDAVMEAQFAELDMGESEKGFISEVRYILPQPARVESYITGIKGKDEDYEMLAEAVDWDKVQIDVKQVELNVDKMGAEESIPAIKPKTAQVDIAEEAEADVIADDMIVELWLPEFDVLEDSSAVAVVEEVSLDKASEIIKEIAHNDVQEVFAVAEPIEYTGYAVFIHTGINE